MAFEITTLQLKDTTDLYLLHPVTGEELEDDKGNKVIITLYGTSSKEYRNAITALQNRAASRKNKPFKPEQAKLEIIELLTECTAKISGLAIHGKEPETKDDYRAMYSDDSLSWIKDQVDAAIGDQSNFLEQSKVS